MRCAFALELKEFPSCFICYGSGAFVVIFGVGFQGGRVVRIFSGVEVTLL